MLIMELVDALPQFFKNYAMLKIEDVEASEAGPFSSLDRQAMRAGQVVGRAVVLILTLLLPLHSHAYKGAEWCYGGIPVKSLTVQLAKMNLEKHLIRLWNDLDAPEKTALETSEAAFIRWRKQVVIEYMEKGYGCGGGFLEAARENGSPDVLRWATEYLAREKATP